MEGRTHSLLIRAHIPFNFWGADFEHDELGRPLYIDASNQKAVSIMSSINTNLKRSYSGYTQGCTISGPSGAGKTFLAYALVAQTVSHHLYNRDANGKRFTANFISEADYLRLCREAIGKKDTDPYTLTVYEVQEQYVTRPSLLIIDDLGAGGVKAGDAGDWARNTIMELYDARYSASKGGKTTVTTTNLTEYEIEARYGARVISRLAGCGPFVPIEAPDFRQVQYEEWVI